MLQELFFLGNIEADAIEMPLTLQFGEQLGLDQTPISRFRRLQTSRFSLCIVFPLRGWAQFVSHHGRILRMNDCRHPVPHGGKLFPGITYIFKQAVIRVND